jgi:D-sedoheptulose 7-phosphate isomerase
MPHNAYCLVNLRMIYNGRNMNRETEIIRQLNEAIEIKQNLQKNTHTLIIIAEQIIKVFNDGNKLVVFGNGGSASDAQHIVAELIGRFQLERPPLPAIALNCNTSSLTAIANDYTYADIFVRQVQALVKQGDAVLGISTSGNSPNVLLGIAEAKKMGAITIAFTGQGGKLKDTADYTLSIPSSQPPRIQEAHITAGHIICYLVEEALFGKQPEK